MGALEKDLRRVEKQRRDLDRLDELVNLLQARQPLRGNWPGHWDCHVSPDWLLLYRVTETKSILVRTGSHAELFE
jgi:mRNA interferase YafQ